MRFIMILFYPWLVAWTCSAYNQYTLSEEYVRRLHRGGARYAFQMYTSYNIVDYWIMAIKKNWMRIIFTPWVFNVHPDMLNFGENEK